MHSTLQTMLLSLEHSSLLVRSSLCSSGSEAGRASSGCRIRIILGSFVFGS